MQNLLNEISGADAYAGLLNAVSISSINDLSKCKADDLALALAEMNGMMQMVEKSPDEAMVAKWIDQAREIDPLFQAQKELKDRVGDIANIYTLNEWQKHLDNFEPPCKHDMHTTLNQIVMVIEQMYVHLSMKRARRAIDYIQSLRLLRQHIDDDMDHLDFHAEMLKRLKSFGDIHTAYRLPPPYRQSVAFLPLLIQKCYSREKDMPRYFATNTLWKPSTHLPLKPGDEIISWNGVPMNKAVENNVSNVEGSNPSANLAFSLQFMTMRWLGATFQPDSPWVIIGYKNKKGRKKEIRLTWHILELKEDPHYGTRAQYLWFMLNPSGAGQPLSSDHALNAGSQVQHVSSLMIFRQDKTNNFKAMSANKPMLSRLKKMHKEGGRRDEMKKISTCERDLQTGDWTTENRGLRTKEVPTTLPMFLECWILSLKSRKNQRFGHIRIRGFPMGGDPRKCFIPELRRLLALMPGDGLLMDVRGNPGGSANLAETALQLLCPREIHPMPFQFVASQLTQQVTNAGNDEYKQWGPSVDMALRTGAIFSSAFPITTPEVANEIGQEYFGPVVLTTSATSYSAADIFSAGFQDHDIGPMMGVDATTGGGGANVLFYRQALGNDIPTAPLPGIPKDQLPSGIDLQFAYRRCLRTGRNLGIPVEEIGVETEPHFRHELTCPDLLEHDVDLRKHAIKLFSKSTRYDLNVTVRETDNTVSATVKSRVINRLEFYLDDRLLKDSKIEVKGGGEYDTTKFRMKRTDRKAHRLKILGYHKVEKKSEQRVARYKHPLKGC